MTTPTWPEELAAVALICDLLILILIFEVLQARTPIFTRGLAAAMRSVNAFLSLLRAVRNKALAGTICLVLSSLGVLATLTACGPIPPVPINHQVVIIFDLSGSTLPLADGWASRAQRWVEDLRDGTRVIVAIADGASGSSICIPRRVDLQGQGNDQTQISDSLVAQRSTLDQVILDQINCAKQNAVDGSDLIGSLMVADANLKPAMDSTQVLMFSDAMQSSEILKLTPRLLTSPTAVKMAVAELESEGLIPLRLAGGELTISDPGVGSGMDARAIQGLLMFWSLYGNNAHANFIGGLR
jgi:hypothetical protein